jgi:uncharacterized protein (UPF0548 family)
MSRAPEIAHFADDSIHVGIGVATFYLAGADVWKGDWK